MPLPYVQPDMCGLTVKQTNNLYPLRADAGSRLFHKTSWASPCAEGIKNMNPQTETVIGHTPDYTLEAGRCIVRDGRPFVTIHGVNPPGMLYSPAEVDSFARDVVRAVNSHADLLAACVTFSVWLMSPDLSKETITKMRATAEAAIAKAR